MKILADARSWYNSTLLIYSGWHCIWKKAILVSTVLSRELPFPYHSGREVQWMIQSLHDDSRIKVQLSWWPGGCLNQGILRSEEQLLFTTGYIARIINFRFQISSHHNEQTWKSFIIAIQIICINSSNTATFHSN